MLAVEHRLHGIVRAAAVGGCTLFAGGDEIAVQVAQELEATRLVAAFLARRLDQAEECVAGQGIESRRADRDLALEALAPEIGVIGWQLARSSEQPAPECAGVIADRGDLEEIGEPS